MNGTIELDTIAVFAKVAQTGGFSSAAELLRLPKSTVSRAVQRLEDQLGLKLFRRTTRSVQLTDAGRSFWNDVSPALLRIEEASANLIDQELAPSGVVRVTAPPDMGAWLLAPLIAQFTAAHPGIHIETVLTGRITNLVEEGIDLAVRAGKLRDSTLTARKLRPLRAGLFASPSYLKAHPAPQKIADLAKHRCVLFRPTDGASTWSFEGPRGDVSVEVRGDVHADDYTFVREVTAAGAGIALMPVFMCEPSCEGGLGRKVLTRILPEYSAPNAGVHLVSPPGRFMPKRVALFRDFLLEHLGARTS